MAGLTLCWVAGLGTHDATTSFRAFSRRLVEDITIESDTGFVLGLEMTVKAHVQGYKVGEVPSTWKDRSAGQSRFRVLKWLPHYLRWYIVLMGPALAVWGSIIVGALAYAIYAGSREEFSWSQLLPVALLASLAVIGVVYVRRRRQGRMRLTDAFAALIWLHPGYWFASDVKLWASLFAISLLACAIWSRFSGVSKASLEARGARPPG
jgi:hypothetical protein